MASTGICVSGTVLVFNAPTLQTGEQESQGKEMVFRPVQFVLSRTELLPLHTES